MPAPTSTPLKPRPRGRRKGHSLDVEESFDQIQHGFYKSFDGTKIFYSVEGSGPPLVFCYGLVCSSLHWTYQIDHFRKNYKSIWFDYRGHQNSQIPEDLDTLKIETFTEDLLGLLNELEIPKAILLGHSMGVNVVLEFAHRHPERVAGLVLANGTPRSPAESIFHNNSLQRGFKLFKQIENKAPSLVKTIWKLQKKSPLGRLIVGFGGFNPHLSAKEDIDLYVEQVLDFDPKVFLTLMRNYDSHSTLPWLHEIKAPSLIIGGEKDHIIPIPQQKLMHQLIAGSQFEMIKHGSHCTQMDLPDLVNNKIQSFINKIPGWELKSANQTTEIASQ